MKKSMKRAIAMALCLIVCFGLCACSGKEKVSNDKNTIQISYVNTGFGMEWLNNAVAKFEAKYPEYNVVVEPCYDSATFLNTIKLGGENNTIDLYLTMLSTEDYNSYLEPLDDVLNYTWAGEGSSIRDKINPNLLQTLTATDKNTYMMSYGGGMISLAYNASIIDGVKYEVPNTTDELVKLTMRLSADGKTPFTTFQYGGYWPYLYKVWIAQYQGLDYYNDELLSFLDENGQPDKTLVMDDNKETGRYQVLKLMEKLLAYQYTTPESWGGKFTAQQTKFLNGSAAMMPNGTWLFNEMRNAVNNDFNFGFMRYPVLSDMVDNLESVKTDKALSALVAAVDAAASVEEVPLSGNGYTATKADVERVWEARHLFATFNDENVAVIPNYSNAKDGAKLFLQFLYSDELIHDYSNIVHMSFCATPTDKEVDTSSWNKWEKDVYELQSSAIPMTKYERKTPFAKQIEFFANIDMWTKFSAQNAADRMSADQFWAQMKKVYEENWEQYKYLGGY